MVEVVYLAVFAVLLAIVSITGAVYFYFRAKEEIMPSAPYIINFASKDNNGRFIGKEIQTKGAAHNRIIIEYKPLDIEIFKLPLKEIKFKSFPEKIITEPEKIISLPIGEISKDMAIKIILADKSDEYPESLKNTILGKGLMWATAEKNLEKTIKEILEEGTYSRDELLKKINGGELTQEWIQTVDSLMKDILKMKVQEDDRRHKTFLPSSLGGSPSGFQR